VCIHAGRNTVTPGSVSLTLQKTDWYYFSQAKAFTDIWKRKNIALFGLKLKCM